MATIFAQSLAANFQQALAVLRAAIDDCPDEMWETDLWPHEAPTRRNEHGALIGSAVWLLAHHALTILDYDLNGDFEMWVAPPPFDDNTWGEPNRVFTKAEMVGYIDACIERVKKLLPDFTDELASRPVPDSHRYGGVPYGVLVSGLPMHTLEHAVQIRQFLTAAGIAPSEAARRASGDNTG